MNDDTKTFCALVRQRSDENRTAMNRIGHGRGLLSPVMAILRQELDSMARTIWLLSITDMTERTRLIQATLSGKKWTMKTDKGKARNITDREMMELAQKLQGWTKAVYKFGCASIHLSDFHNYALEDPFRQLPETERQDILQNMRNYYGGPSGANPDIEEIARYLPQVLDKIARNLECYLKSLEDGEVIE